MSSYIENRETRDSAYAVRQNYFKDIEKYLLGFEQKAVENRLEVLWVNDEEQLVSTIESQFKSKYNKVCFDLPEIPATLASHHAVKRITPQTFEAQENIPDIVITNADFAVAETGEIVLLDKKTQNCFNLVQNIIIILDISKIVARRTDLDLILCILADSKHGAAIHKDVKFIRQPFAHVESNEFFSSSESNYSRQDVKITVLLYDNGVSDILRNENLREALYCIDCGLCAKVCPVFAITGKHSPIALVKAGISEQDSDIVFRNTTLCGNCDSVCPVAIPFNELLTKEMTVSKEGAANKFLSKFFLKRNKMNALNSRLRRFFILKKIFNKNKKLFNYFFSIKEDFFNIQQKEQ